MHNNSVPNCKYPKFEAAVEAMKVAIQENNNSAVEDAKKQLFKAQEVEMSNGVSDIKGLLLHFQASALGIENHIRTGDLMSAVVLFGSLSDNYKEIVRTSPFSRLELLPIEKLLFETAEHLIKATGYSNKETKTKDDKKKDVDAAGTTQSSISLAKPTDICKMCGEKNSVCTGSHLAPHFLIQSFLSYNGTSKRHTEVVNETTMAGYHKERKWGREVPGEQIDEVFGGVPDDEKVSIKAPSLTRDYLFCNECEKRFGFIEEAYAKSFNKKQPCQNGLIAYLFWLGVFWRLSVGKMAIQLNKKDEIKIGDILNRLMPADTRDIKTLLPADDMGLYGYSVYHCSETKGELSGVIGNHSDQSPYRLLVGEYVIFLYSNKEKAPEGIRLNDYQHPEEWEEIPFIDYWKKKQYILDTNRRYEYRRLGETDPKIVDIVKGDHLKNVPSILGGSWAQEFSIKTSPKHSFYEMKLPGSLIKLFSLLEQHPELDKPEEINELVEKELGYTHDEIQEMYDYWNEHLSIQKVNTGSKLQKKTPFGSKKKGKRKRKKNRC